MAEGAVKANQTCNHLNQVFDVLLDSSKTVVDDTSLQRLLLYCRDLFAPKGILANEDGMQCLEQFLESCCNVGSTNSEESLMNFDPSALTFALQLVRSVSSNPEILGRFMKEDGSVSKGLVARLIQRALGEDILMHPHTKEALLQLLSTISTDAQKFIDVCRGALPVALDLLDDSSMFVMKAAQKFLSSMIITHYHEREETNKDVGKSSNTSGARDMDRHASYEPTNSGKDSKRLASSSVVEQCLLETQNTAGEEAGGDVDVFNSQSNCMSSSFAASVSMKRPFMEVGTESTHSKADLEDARQTECKRQRLLERSFSGETSLDVQAGITDIQNERTKVDLQNEGRCKGSVKNLKELCISIMRNEDMGTALACLLVDLEPSHVQPLSVLPNLASQQHKKKALSSIGVFICLVSEAEGKEGTSWTDRNHSSNKGSELEESSDKSSEPSVSGSEKENLSLMEQFLEECKKLVLSLLDEVALVTRCCRLLCESKQLAAKVCDEVVDLLCCILKVQSKRRNYSMPEHVLQDVDFLQVELIGRGFVRPAIYLATALLRLCSKLSERTDKNFVDVAKKSLTIIIGPLHTVLKMSPDAGSDDAILTGLGTRIADGKTALPLLCASVGALQETMKENQDDLQRWSNVDVLHITVALIEAVSPGRTSSNQSSGLPHEYRSLIGSRRLMMSLLDLAQIALKETSSRSDIVTLLEILSSLLKDPDTDCRVMMKILDTIPSLLPLAFADEGDTVRGLTPIKELGYAVQKSLCNMEWEVRDSAITCVHKLLQKKELQRKKSDKVTEWILVNNLHKRIWESLVDGESYVRAACLQAIPAIIMDNKVLWDDLRKGANISELDVLNQVAEVVTSDSEAFARRAAMDCLHNLMDKPDRRVSWLADAFRMYIQTIAHKWYKSTDDSKSLDRKMYLKIGERLLKVLETAVTDLDWEVKSHALRSLTEMVRYIHFISISKHERWAGHLAEKARLEATDWKPKEDLKCHVYLLLKTGCLEMLLRASKDEDTSVSCKACEVLQGIKEVLSRDLNSDLTQFRSIKVKHPGKGGCDSKSLPSTSNHAVPGKFPSEEGRENVGKAKHTDPEILPSTPESVIYDLSTIMSSTSWLQILSALCPDKEFGQGGLKMEIETGQCDYDVADTDSDSSEKDYDTSQGHPQSLGCLESSEGNRKEVKTGQGGYETEGTMTSSCGSTEEHCSMTTSCGSTEEHCGMTTSCGSTEEHCSMTTSFGSTEEHCSMIEQLLSTDWNSLSKKREDEHVEGPVSLMVDIVAAAGDHEENLLDCY